MVKTDENLTGYIDDFFNNIELYDDVHNDCDYKETLKTYIDMFLADQTKEAAYKIYETFFEIYRIVEEDKSEHELNQKDNSNTLLKLVGIMKKYEENTGDLIDKQRDHFIHSVNVFLLGLSIYSQNEKYQKFFKDYVKNSHYTKYYRFENGEVTNEEFLYRWGIASLFHDIGYPVEIIGQQMRTYIKNSVQSIDKSYNVNPSIDFKDFNDFNTIVKQKSDFADKFRENYPHAKFLNMFKPTDIMACKIYDDFKGEIDLRTLTRHLDNFVHTMSENGFIDHGFFSSILVLNSYGYLIQNYKTTYSFFFYPIVDSASAILLHNYYRRTLQEEPFNLGRMSAKKSPIAFMLILCDELQEWNRQPWGLKDQLKTHVDDMIADITPDSLYIKYIVEKGMGNEFLKEKKELIETLLDVPSIFKNDIDLKTNIEADNLGGMKEIIYNEIETTDPLLRITSRLPRYLYEFYSKNNKNAKDIPFSELPVQERYSNIRQANSISKNLKIIGCEMALRDDETRKEYTISPAEIEDLAMFEHKDWCCEKTTAGWTQGSPRDNTNLIHPSIVSWKKLDKDSKDYNIKTMENIPAFLESLGLKIVVNDTRLLALGLHEYYNEVYDMTGENPFDGLSPDDKYFNYVQSGLIIKALNQRGYEVVLQNGEGEAISEFNEDEIVPLAIIEHNNWCDYKTELGWKYDPEKSNENKTNPNLQEWEKVSEDTRQFNIDTIKNLPRICSYDGVGLKIIKA